jgi:hypothetical protein
LKRNNNNDNNFSNSSIIHEQNAKGTAPYRVVVMTHELNYIALNFSLQSQWQKSVPLAPISVVCCDWLRFFCSGYTDLLSYMTIWSKGFIVIKRTRLVLRFWTHFSVFIRLWQTFKRSYYWIHYIKKYGNTYRLEDVFIVKILEYDDLNKNRFLLASPCNAWRVGV